MPESVKESTRHAGRPPAGYDGAAVRDYPSVMLRLPPATAAKLRAWSDVSGVPAWRLMTQAIEAALDQLEGADAEDVQRLARRYVGRYRR